MDIRKIDLNLLMVLEVLLEELHISRSAKRLNMSQPAVSRSLFKLREFFEDPLIVRVSKGYRRTPRGDDIANSIRKLLNDIETTLSNPIFDPGSFRSEFTICTLDFGESVLLPNIMDRVLEEAPDVSIKILHRKIYSISEVLDGAAHILLGTIPDNPPKHCHVQHLFYDRYVCVMDRRHPLANVPLTLEGYLQYPHSIIHTGESPGTPLDEDLARQGMLRKIAKRSPHFTASLLSIRGSKMLQTVPERLAEAVLDKKEFVIKEMPIETSVIPIGQMWHSRYLNDPAHSWFRNIIAESI